MSSPAILIRNAVVAVLAQGEADDVFSPLSVAPRAAMIVNVKRTDPSLDVVVVAVGREINSEARGTDANDYAIEIGVLQKLDEGSINADAEARVELVERICNFLRSEAGRIDQAPDGAEWTPVNAIWLSSSIDPMYDHERLRRLAMFASVQRVVYRYYADRNGA